VLTSPKDTQRYLTLRFAELEHEVFAILYLTLCGAAVYAKTLHYSAALA
jgi:DNA repair protein RadC